MKKFFIVMCSTFILSSFFSAMKAEAFVVQGLKCLPNPAVGHAPATSFLLFRKLATENTFIPIEEQTTCNFQDQNIDDTSETCFQFAAKNAGGVTMRGTISFCIDPRKSPPSPPIVLGVD